VSPLLLGRKNECQVLDDFLAATRKGDGGAIVVHGDPGMGKTALLEYAVASAREFDVFRTVGNEAEMELPYAALHQLCRLGLGEVEGLARLQRDVLGRREGAAPDQPSSITYPRCIASSESGPELSSPTRGASGSRPTKTVRSSHRYRERAVVDPTVRGR
jgi:hypothetical protein